MEAPWRLRDFIFLSFIIIFSALSTLALSTVTPCNQGNQTTCLQAVRDILKTTEWWFGDSYSSVCPESQRLNDYECLNPCPEWRSIADRLLTDLDVDSIQQLLQIRFNVEGGSYFSCGRGVAVPSVYMSSDLDPTVTEESDLWTLSHRPAVRWTDDARQEYTLLAYDVSTMKLSGLWVNILGGDSSFGLELYPYSGPEAGVDRITFLVFLLFKQAADIPPSKFPELQHIIEDHINSTGDACVHVIDNILTSASELHRSPEAVGLLRVRADDFGIEQLRQRDLLNNCPWLIQGSRPELQRLIDTWGLVEFGAYVNEMEVGVQVEFVSNEIEFTSCGESYTEPEMFTTVDPTSDATIKPVFLRNQPIVHLSQVNSLNSLFKTESFFTLMFLDVTYAVSFGSRDGTSLLWLVTDVWDPYPSGRSIPEGTSTEYHEPLPRLDTGGSSTYVMLAFRQTMGEMGAAYLTGYCSDGSQLGLCDLDLYQYVKDKNLQFSGATLLSSQPDPYSRMIMYERGILSMDVACSSTVNISTPEPVSTPDYPSTDEPSTPDTTVTDSSGSTITSLPSTTTADGPTSTSTRSSTTQGTRSAASGHPAHLVLLILCGLFLTYCSYYY